MEAFPTPRMHAVRSGPNAPQLAVYEQGEYMLWFQKPGVAEAMMDPKVRELMEKLLRKAADPAEILAQRAAQDGPPSMNPFLPDGGEIGAFGDPLVSPEELDYYVRTYERTGFRGGINWYRNVDRNLKEVPGLGQAKLDLPCLMLTAEWDLAIRPEMAAGMPALIDDLEMHMIPKAGHWVQQEAPGLVNEYVVEWLKRRFKAGA